MMVEIIKQLPLFLHQSAYFKKIQRKSAGTVVVQVKELYGTSFWQGKMLLKMSTHLSM